MIEIQLENLEELTKKLDPKLVSRALALANSKTAQKTRTFIGKEVRKEFYVSAKTVKQHVSLMPRGGDSKTDVLLVYKGKRLSLRHFNISETKNVGGVTVRNTYRGGELKKNRSLRRKQKRSKTKLRVRLSKKKGIQDVRALGVFGSSSMKKRLAFFSRAKGSGTMQVFVRDETKSSRKQLTKLTGPSVAQMVSNSRVMKQAFDFIRKEHVEQLHHHIEKLQEGIIK